MGPSTWCVNGGVLCDYSLQIVYLCISGAIPSETSTKLSAEAPIKEGPKTLGNEAVSVIP